MKMRIWLVLSSAVIIGLFAAPSAMGHQAVPQWLLTTVHNLVVSDQNQTSEIAALSAHQADQDQVISTLVSRLSADETKLACFRSIGVTVAHVRTLNGEHRYVLRVPSQVGRTPFARLVRTTC
jgi:hypothetical protein